MVCFTVRITCSRRWIRLPTVPTQRVPSGGPRSGHQIDGHAFKGGDCLSLEVVVVVAFTDVIPQIGSVILVDDGAAAAGHEKILTALIHHVTSGRPLVTGPPDARPGASGTLTICIPPSGLLMAPLRTMLPSLPSTSDSRSFNRRLLRIRSVIPWMIEVNQRVTDGLNQGLSVAPCRKLLPECCRSLLGGFGLALQHTGSSQGGISRVSRSSSFHPVRMAVSCSC